MATFGELITEVGDKLDQSALATSPTAVTSPVAKAINRAIDYFEPERFWFNEEEVDITLTVNTPTVPNMPSDFQYELEDGGVTINYSSTRYPVRKVSLRQYDRENFEGKGLPYSYKEYSGNIDVYFYPDQAYTLILRYIKSYADMTATSDTNDWTTNAPRLIVAKALEDLYLDRRHSKPGGLYDQYVAKRKDEHQQLQDKNIQRTTSGRLEVESMFDGERRHSYYGAIY